MRCVRTKTAKASSALALTLALCLTAAGQNPAPAVGHGILVRSHGWHRERPGWDRQVPDRGVPVRGGAGSYGVSVEGGAVALPRPIYWYKARVGNEGRREARAVVWEYRVTEKATGRVTAHRFRSEVRLKPGARAELKASSYEQPSGVVSAESGGKGHREAFEEAVVIVRVEYADGGAWEVK